MRRGHGSLYDIAVPGYKANLSDVLATIALVQLGKLERHGEIRAPPVRALRRGRGRADGIEPLARDPRDTHALHLYVVRIDAERAGATRDGYQAALAEENIGTSIHFLPVHELTAYREVRPAAAARDRARRDEVLSLPLSPAHSDDDIGTRSTRSAGCTRASPALAKRLFWRDEASDRDRGEEPPSACSRR